MSKLPTCVPPRPPLGTSKHVIAPFSATKISLLARGRAPNTPSLRSLSPSTRSISNNSTSSTPKNSRPVSRRRYLSSSGLPSISSKHWCVYEMNSGRVLHGIRDLEAVEVASLTKIMTFYLALKLTKRFGLHWDTSVPVSEHAAGTNGTSADLRPNDKVSLWDIFFALMLPSGNDAAVAIAEYFGSLISPGHPQPKSVFVLEMNRVAQDLGLLHTSYMNPHGLTKKRNLSSARDTCKLAGYAMRLEVFRQVVNTREHTALILGADRQLRPQTWINTNKLLGKGFNGVKTGVTLKAGPCLCVSKSLESGERLIIIILNCRSMDARWQEVRKLAQWGSSRYTNLLD